MPFSGLRRLQHLADHVVARVRDVQIARAGEGHRKRAAEGRAGGRAVVAGVRGRSRAGHL